MHAVLADVVKCVAGFVQPICTPAAWQYSEHERESVLLPDMSSCASVSPIRASLQTPFDETAQVLRAAVTIFLSKTVDWVFDPWASFRGMWAFNIPLAPCKVWRKGDLKTRRPSNFQPSPSPFPSILHETMRQDETR